MIDLRTLAFIGMLVMALLFYILIFWGIPSLSFLNKGSKIKHYFLFVLILHSVVGIIMWGAWGLDYLQRL